MGSPSGYILPTFNLDVNIWRSTSDPTSDPPDVTAIGNLAWGRRGAAPASGGTSVLGVVFVAPVLLLPALTDVRDDPTLSGLQDIVEVPAGTGRYYTVSYVDDLGKGFDNEHRGAVLVKTTAAPLLWPVPYP